jgi:hypothetical protein
MLFLQNNLLYPRNKKLKSFRRRKKTINFRLTPLNPSRPSGHTTTRRQVLFSNNLSERKYIGRVGVLNWVKLRKTRLTSYSKTRLVTKRSLKSFSLIPRGDIPRGLKKIQITKKPLPKVSKSRRPRRKKRTRLFLNRFKHKYNSKKLKFHLRYLSLSTNPNTENYATVLWRRNSPLQSLQPVYNNVVFSIHTGATLWYIQNLSTNAHTNQPLLLDKLLHSLVIWLRHEHCQFTTLVSLNNRTYLNDKVISMNQFFNMNRISLLPVDSCQAFSVKVDSLLSKKPLNFFNQYILSSRSNTVNHPISFTTRTRCRKWINTVLLLSYRYMPYLSIQKFYRDSGKYGKLCTYWLNRRRAIRPAVSLTDGEMPISVFPIAYSNRLYKPYKGISNLLKASANDNLLEHCCDNHTSLAVYSRLSSSVIGLLRSLKIDLIAREHAPNIRYFQSWGSLKTLPFHISHNPQNTSPRKTFISKSNLLFTNPWISRELYSNPILFKYFLWNQFNLSSRIDSVFTKSFLQPYMSEFHRYNFSSRVNFYENSNLWPSIHLNFTIKRKLFKRIHSIKFVPNVTMWYYDTLVKFIEHYTSRRVYLKFNPFIENSLTYVDLARCSMWEPRVYAFQRILGHRIFVNESLKILHLALRFRDPAFLSHWMKTMLYRMSFWKYRLLFRYVKFTMRYLFWPHFEELGFKGLKFILRGKISVAGNARTRTLVYTIGETSHAKVNNRVLSEFTTVNSFTGVMGFLVSFYF